MLDLLASSEVHMRNILRANINVKREGQVYEKNYIHYPVRKRQNSKSRERNVDIHQLIGHILFMNNKHYQNKGSINVHLFKTSTWYAGLCCLLEISHSSWMVAVDSNQSCLSIIIIIPYEYSWSNLVSWLATFCHMTVLQFPMLCFSAVHQLEKVLLNVQ